tara:strand:- start:931 stop:1059 length:129 start_codon:yes stop_codon:yes gene_type:complete
MEGSNQKSLMFSQFSFSRKIVAFKIAQIEAIEEGGNKQFIRD